MTGAQTWMHLVSLFFFGASILIWASVLHAALRFRFAAAYKWVGAITSVSGMVLSALFIALQLEWVVSGHNESVGNVVSYLWLVWDYCMGVFLVFLGLWSRTNTHLLANRCEGFLAVDEP